MTSFPCGVCNMCRFLIYECEKNNSKELEGRPGATERWTNFKLEKILSPVVYLQQIVPVLFVKREGLILLGKQGLET